jgi:class 3 adenylate cyclase
MPYSSFSDRFALVFDDPRIEQSFLDYYETIYSHVARISLGLSGVMLFVSFLIDSIQYPFLYANNFRIIIGIPLIVGVTFLSLTKGTRKNWQTTMSFFVVIFATFNFLLLIKIDAQLGLGLASWVGIINFIFLELLCFLILGLQFRRACISGALIMIGFVLTMYWSMHGTMKLFSHYALHVFAMFILIAYMGWWRERNIRNHFKFGQKVEAERIKYQSILSSILPGNIVDRIKAGERTIVEEYGEVSILFADLEGFTSLASRLGPKHLIEVLEEVFTEFDRICSLHKVEKIKTIGDCYMAASGMSSAAGVQTDAAWNAMCAARDMVNFFTQYVRHEGLPLGIRVGIHTGPVIGGVLGNTKPHFDVWGNTVNLANHMESRGEEGLVQVSETTWFRVQKKFEFSSRREVEIKGKGKVAAYLHDPRTAPLGECETRSNVLPWPAAS